MWPADTDGSLITPAAGTTPARPPRRLAAGAARLLIGSSSMPGRQALYAQLNVVADAKDGDAVAQFRQADPRPVRRAPTPKAIVLDLRLELGRQRRAAQRTRPAG